jgi:BirA family biotin operon repressor/biotin-[acetyl-CoA-carboxylase] ligase
MPAARRRWHASCILEYNLGVLSEERLRARLPVHGLGAELVYYSAIGSTNDEAAARARQGAREGLVVVADEQTAGRGRAGRSWLTPPGSAIALSIVLRPRKVAPEAIGGLSALGALAVAEALDKLAAVAQIKWPNDVLLAGRKVAGVLVDGAWVGQEIEYAIVGIGVNVRPASVPSRVDFPATCVEAVLARSIDRSDLIVAVLEGVARWVPRLGTTELLGGWESRLAYRGEEVSIVGESGKEEMRGVVEGLLPDGRLRLRSGRGASLVARPEGYRLRLVDMTSV